MISKNNQLNKNDILNKSLEHYWNRLELDINNNQLHPEGIEGYILLLAEYWEYLEDKEKWLSNAWNLLIALRSSIPKEIHMAGIFGGLIGKLFCIISLSEKTKYFDDIKLGLLTITQMVIEKNIVRYRNDINNLRPEHFDFTSGLSGTGLGLIYLRKKGMCQSSSNLIYDIEKYLVSLTLSDWGFKVKRENQLREADYIQFKNGSIDFGAAHGMVGPLLFLSAAYFHGYIVKDIIISIEKIIDIYMRYATVDEHKVVQWPSQISCEHFDHMIIPEDIRNHRMSWCYGSLGISYNLYNIGCYMNLKWLMDFSLNNLLNIANMQTEYYLLDAPILCHGYSGILLIFQLLYKKTKIVMFKNKVIEMLSYIRNSYNPDTLYGFNIVGVTKINGVASYEEVEMFDILSGASGIHLSTASLFHSKCVLDIFMD